MFLGKMLARDNPVVRLVHAEPPHKLFCLVAQQYPLSLKLTSGPEWLW